MCLAAPAKIISRSGYDAVVEVEGVRREIHLALVPDAQLGDYVLVHAGFAIQRWSEADVAEFRSMQQELESTL
jgi:hydrogenase expression/formation protein HypC